MHREELIALGVLFALVFAWMFVANHIMPSSDSNRPGADYGGMNIRSIQS